jgi:hypothetical protein
MTDSDVLKETVRQILDALSLGRFSLAISLCLASRLTEHDLDVTMRNYGCTFVVPPIDAYAALDAVRVTNQPVPAWSVRAPLWTR